MTQHQHGKWTHPPEDDAAVNNHRPSVVTLVDVTTLVDDPVSPHTLIQQLRAEIEHLRAIVRRYQERDDYQAQKFTHQPCVCEICADYRKELRRKEANT